MQPKTAPAGPPPGAIDLDKLNGDRPMGVAFAVLAAGLPVAPWRDDGEEAAPITALSGVTRAWGPSATGKPSALEVVPRAPVVAVVASGAGAHRELADAAEVLGALPATLTSSYGGARAWFFTAPAGAELRKPSRLPLAFDGDRFGTVGGAAGTGLMFADRARIMPGSRWEGARIAELPAAWAAALSEGPPVAALDGDDTFTPSPANDRAEAPEEAAAVDRIEAALSTDDTDDAREGEPDPVTAEQATRPGLAKADGDVMVAPAPVQALPPLPDVIAVAKGAAAEKVAKSSAEKTAKAAREAKAAKRAEQASEGGAGEGGGRPVIELRADVHEVEAEAVAALAGAGLYQRLPSGLVEVIEAPELEAGASDRERAHAPDPGLPLLQPVTAPRLRSILSERATFTRYDARRKEWSPVSPPRDIVEGVLARKVYPTSAARTLRGVVEAPIMRPDGSVFEAPGPGDHYDPATGLLLRWRGPAIGLLERPTLDDARRAFAGITRPFVDLVFTGDERRRGASLAACVAAMLTPIARPSIAGPVPAFVWTADRENAGKSLAAKVCGLVAMGRPPAARPWPVGEGEMAKVLTGFALTSLPVGLFDDTCHAIGGGDFDAAVTAWPEYAPRILGTNTSPSLPWVTTLYVTANGAEARNPSAAGRLVFCELFGRGRGEHARAGATEREYTFPDLIRHVQENRAAYLRDALTILRAYQLAGSPRPAGARRRDSFEAWSERVAWPLLWCSGFSPVEAHAPAGADAEGEAMRAAVITWRGAYGFDGPPVTASELREQLLAADPAKSGASSPAIARSRVQLRGLLSELCGVPDLARATSKSLGRHLTRIVGLDIEAPDGVCLVLTSHKNRNGVTEYTLARKGAGFAGFAGSTSEATHGNCQSVSPDGGNDNDRHFAGEAAETNPANPANPAVESWDA